MCGRTEGTPRALCDVKVFRTLHDEFRHGTASTPAKRSLAPTGARLVSLAFPLFRTALASPPRMLFCLPPILISFFGMVVAGEVGFLLREKLTEF
jgi:hypothetical protein